MVLLSALICACITFLFYSLYYPLKFRTQIENTAAEFDLSPALICSIINVESSFNEDARSSRGALGLMQLMPETASSIALALDENFNENMLFDGETNIRYGAYYISSLLKSFEFEEALCAYNAGPTRVRGWLKSQQYSNDGVKLKNIPFEETKSYVERVKKNLNFYQNKF